MCNARVAIDRSGSRSNIVHADIVCAFLQRAVQRGALTGDTLPDVLVITPFIAQARVLERVLSEHFGRSSPQVRTVHRCQGREASVVILDLVDAANASSSRFLSASSFRAEGGRLLTVAATRARDHLVVIGDMSHLRGAGTIARDFVHAVAARGRRVSPSLLGIGTRAA
jgi:superfamily I DNA and/or RNA helicase